MGLCMGPHLGHAERLCMRAGPSGSHLAAIVADHTFFQYERTLQREYNPELSISLPAFQSAGSPAISTAQPQSAAAQEPPRLQHQHSRQQRQRERQMQSRLQRAWMSCGQ